MKTANSFMATLSVSFGFEAPHWSLIAILLREQKTSRGILKEYSNEPHAPPLFPVARDVHHVAVGVEDFERLRRQYSRVDRVAFLHHGRLVHAGVTRDLLESAQRAEIAARGVATESFPDATSADGLVRFSVPTARQRAAIERVWALGGEVVSVNPVRRSLEEIFVELTAATNTSRPPS